jgi:hypothetical protein
MTITLPPLPKTVLTPLDCSVRGVPDHAAITILENEVYANARSVYSSLGTGRHGHLFLVTDGPTYMALTGAIAVVVPPANPGDRPFIAQGATQYQIQATTSDHKAALAHFQLANLVEATLMHQLLEAIPETHIAELRDARMGFSNVSSLGILTHLRTTYGIVTPEDLKINLKNLSRQWGPEQPLSDLWDQIKKCQDFAAGTAEPISDATVLRTTIDNLEDSGAFIHDVRDWRKLPPAQQTLAALKLHFKVADNERTRILGSKSAGYANVAKPPDLSKPIPNPVPSHAMPTIAQSHTYCWSHGLNLQPGRHSHTSQTCKSRLPGHCDTATLMNRMGGCNMIQSAYRDARVTWVRPPNDSTSNKENTGPPN